MTTRTPLTVEDPQKAAKKAGLRYVSDLTPGIRRIKKGSGFSYVRADGKSMKDAATLKRIAAIVIPPAWTDVWICPQENGHIQATGRDEKRRKQYRYHADWRAHRDGTKYGKMIAFGALLPAIRKAIDADLSQPGLPREKVLACVVRLLDRTHLRIGNDEYARDNESYGLTTLRKKHADVKGSHVVFDFTGKSGQHQRVELKDESVARVIRKCEELPGYELFKYVDDDGATVDVGSEDINAYLRTVTGEDISAKDFRTWGGTVQAAFCLLQAGECDTESETKRMEAAAVSNVAAFLGNRPATCRKYYIDPRIFTAYRKRILCEMLARELTKNKKYSKDAIRPLEAAVLALLQAKI